MNACRRGYIPVFTVQFTLQGVVADVSSKAGREGLLKEVDFAEQTQIMA